MCPEPFFRIFGLGVTGYALAGVAAGFAGFAFAIILARARGFTYGLFDFWFAGCAIGLGGAYLFSCLLPLLDPVFPEWIRSWTALLSGGVASMGGLAAPLIAWAIMARLVSQTRNRVGDVMDITGPVLALFQGISRYSCLSAGCCHGLPAYDLPWAIVFKHPETNCIYRGIPLHPTQLYLSFGNLLLLAVLMALWFRPWFRGQLVYVYLLGYGVLRFAVEFYRGDVRPMIGMLSLFQVICLAFIIIGTWGLARHSRSQCTRPRKQTG